MKKKSESRRVPASGSLEMEGIEPGANGRMRRPWRRRLLAVSFSALLSACAANNGAPSASFGTWAWVSGGDTINRTGIYGTLGAAAPSNVPGGRHAAVSWRDAAGRFWLFGGEGYDSAGHYGYLNDLWRYDPATLEWTWVSGGNMVNPPGVYGAQGTAAPSNVPGGRDSAVAWIDATGKLWLFGGGGYDSIGSYGYLNDLWRYDPAASEWTWVSGGDVCGQKGIYGTQGTAAASNVPGSRYGATGWLDSGGSLWLFGGFGFDYLDGAQGYLNDTWKFDPVTLEWTWIGGSTDRGQNGVYGVPGAAAPSNVPGGRYGTTSGLDASGNFWLFGGFGMGASGYDSYLNDLWKFDMTTLEWTWESGSNTINQPGVYGTLGTAASSNIPGTRDGAVCWIDADGNFWFFGGVGLDSADHAGFLNDLWRYTR